MHIKTINIDHALHEVSKILLEKGIPRQTRGYDCVEIGEPIMVTISRPTDRYIMNEGRGWNKFLGAAESLWLLNGVNGMDFVGKVVKNLYNFSDDSQTMRAGYGPRIRAFNGIADDYQVHSPKHRSEVEYDSQLCSVDQLKYVVELLKEQPDTRQASITIHDPAKDCFNSDGSLKTTKDQPCTRLIQFMIVDGKLDATVFMRSNDFLWGFSAVNVYNFTVLQEVAAGLIGVPIGNYHHIANNLHYYANFKPKVEDVYNVGFRITNQTFEYDFKGVSLEGLDVALASAYDTACMMVDNKNPHFEIMFTGVDMVDDMLKVLTRKFQKNTEHKFKNPFLDRLFNE